MFCALPISLFLWIIREAIGSSIFGQVFNHLSTEIICSNMITGLPCIVIILNSAIACSTKPPPPPPLPSPIHTWIWHRVSRSPEICRCCVQNIILLRCLHIHKESFTILGPGLSTSLCPAYIKRISRPSHHLSTLRLNCFQQTDPEIKQGGESNDEWEGILAMYNPLGLFLCGGIYTVSNQLPRLWKSKPNRPSRL